MFSKHPEGPRFVTIALVPTKEDRLISQELKVPRQITVRVPGQLNLEQSQKLLVEDQ